VILAPYRWLSVVVFFAPDAEESARAFATEVARHVAIIMTKNIFTSPEPDAQKHFVIAGSIAGWLRPAPVEVTNVRERAFTSYFFDPHGTFHAQLKYPAASGQLDMDISWMTVWQMTRSA
jgi:hypothetical protein